MILFDKFIDRILELSGDKKMLEKAPTKMVGATKNDILFANDTAFELGGGQLPCVSTLAVSSDKSFSNSAYLIGRDLTEIKEDAPFGKVVLLEIEDVEDDDEAFKCIKELDQIKYKIYIKDFMSRASAFSMREQIRVGKNAKKQGYSFADYGSYLIEEYKKNPLVKSVDIIFFIDFEGYAELNSIAQRIKDTTSALNHILDNVLFDCSSCNLKPICDEVEGMKELHIKNVGR